MGKIRFKKNEGVLKRAYKYITGEIPMFQDEYQVVRFMGFYLLLREGQPVYKVKAKGIQHKPMYEILGILKAKYEEIVFETAS